MQSVSSRIWSRVAVSIFYNDNHYTTYIYIYICAIIIPGYRGVAILFWLQSFNAEGFGDI